MDGNTSWQDFCSQYYEQAMKSAQYHLNTIKDKTSHWDTRIDEEAIMLDAVMTALEKSYAKYDPSRGTQPITLLSHIIHNELVNELRRETASLASLHEFDDSEEKEITLKHIVSRIPEDALENLKERLRLAILKLSPIDQSILGFFIDNPKTFIEESTKALNVPENFVSVHKNRALAKLPALMGVSRSDYNDMFEETVSFRMLQNKKEGMVIKNPVCPQFNLEATVTRLYDALCAVMG